MTTTSSKPSSESCPAMAPPEIERILDGHKRFLLPNLRKYRKPTPPQRPGRFDGEDDNATLMKIRDARLRDKRTETDKETLKWFGIWRGDVMRYEAKCESNLLVLLRAANTFARAGDETTSFNLLMFAGTQYGFHLASAETTETERRRLAWKHSRAPEAMSDKFLHEGLGPVRRKKQPPEPTQIQLEEVF